MAATGSEIYEEQIEQLDSRQTRLLENYLPDVDDYISARPPARPQVNGFRLLQNTDLDIPETEALKSVRTILDSLAEIGLIDVENPHAPGGKYRKNGYDEDIGVIKDILGVSDD